MVLSLKLFSFQEVKFSQIGTVITLFRDKFGPKTMDHFGGLIKLYDSRQICFFLSSCCSKKMILNDVVKADLHPFKLFERDHKSKNVSLIKISLRLSQKILSFFTFTD